MGWRWPAGYAANGTADHVANLPAIKAVPAARGPHERDDAVDPRPCSVGSDAACESVMAANGKVQRAILSSLSEMHPRPRAGLSAAS